MTLPRRKPIRPGTCRSRQRASGHPNEQGRRSHYLITPMAPADQKKNWNKPCPAMARTPPCCSMDLWSRGSGDTG